MGILDEAIREHLELKRQHGADESELKGLEDEAFGEAERPDATAPSATSEAETQIISPGSSVTSPAGEGDQLDKVFEAPRQRAADAANLTIEQVMQSMVEGCSRMLAHGVPQHTSTGQAVLERLRPD